MSHLHGGGVSKKTTLEDVASIVKPDEILSAALDAGTDDTGSIWYEAVSGTSSASGISSAFTITPRTAEEYQIIVNMNGYVVSGRGSITGTITYNVSYDSVEKSASYTTVSSSVTVLKNGTESSLSATVSDFAGTVSSITITTDVDTISIDVTPSTTVTPDRFSGSYESGSETIQGSESEGLGNGSEESPYSINSSATALRISDFGENTYFRLDSDIQLNEVIEVTVSGIILDLNNHSIKNDTTNVIEVTGEGTLIINGSGTISASVKDKLALIAYDGGSAVINGGSYVSENGSGVAAGILRTNLDVPYFSGGSLTINGGSVESREFSVMAWGSGKLVINDGNFVAHDNAVIGTNGTNCTVEGIPYPEYDITINGGTFEGHIVTTDYIACGLYAANRGTVLIDGGLFEITDGAGVVVRAGNVTITDNVEINLLKSDETITEGMVGDSKIQITANSAVVVDERSQYPGGELSVDNRSNYPSVNPAGEPYVEGDITE